MEYRYLPMTADRAYPFRWASEGLAARDRAAALLRDSAHGLRFEAEEHRYFLGGRELRSVSSIVESYAPFDAMAAAKHVSRNRRSPMYGKTPGEIVSIWRAKGDEACAAGSAVHAFAEACFTVATGHPEDIAAELQGRFMAGRGLRADNAKEAAAARWWADLDTSRYMPVARETMLANPAYNYAGTLDLLLFDMQEKHYVLKDYKTNADIYRWYGKWLRPPLTPIKDNDVGKYTLQQNLYKIQLDNIGVDVGAMDLIWLKDDGSYEEVHIKDYSRLVRYAMEQEIAYLQQKKASRDSSHG